MSDFPTVPTPTHIHMLSEHFLGGVGCHRTVLGSLTPLSGAWGVANGAVYVPFTLPFYYPVRRVFWSNGSGVGGNSSIGIYDTNGTALYTSGSVACSGASICQYLTPSSEILLTPGAYFLGYSHSATSANQCGTCGSTTTALRLVGCYQETSALPLPAVATFAAVSTLSAVPFAGLTRTASGF